MQLSVLATLAVGCLAFADRAHAAIKGSPWGADSRWNPRILGGNSSVVWYHHWAGGAFPTYSNVEFVPTFWGPQKNISWYKRKAEMQNYPPKNILAFNEPDVPTQSNLTPSAALDLYTKEIWPLKAKFPQVQLSSPQICYDISWLNAFMTGARATGVEPDFLAVHWYGSLNFTRFTKYITQIRTTYPTKDIWITEIGLTNKANATSDQAKYYMAQMLNWTSTQPYIKRVTWTGFWATGSPPDTYISPNMALFNPNGTLTELGLFYSRS
ncbi:hypothetical protein OC846_002576 [Tilletia horrida]|uniref:Asl1-like glycosyl hydrolase catalytic domain-containing protein n=1 Tax=Tilletia horrida TaxID=155126 RepID=A0AAN6GWS7_9BASI|nr:hypothetical protein OC845_003452 [Tilletia horrida]KAK0553331.1 hypothetical protein OC846_002576 [Tilletia horrida]KAK0567716.1 hypothetical protein OC861_002572 [Tilletia horrida]